ncbi:hypothetical protein BKA69DRAFT_720242 [Paraphysoderma sedebokerense]|nr:hypothetical protein BKA69DRAFT_720242 [Paraphysoderma sedebokerense]
MQMTTQTIYIVFFSQNRLGIRWFSPIEFQWNSTATISNSNIRSRTVPNTINDANIVLSSQDTSLYVGVHSFNCPPSAANCTGYSLNSFSYSSNSMTWSYDNSERLLSVELDCRECQSKARLIGPSEIRYFDLVDRAFSSPSTISPSQQIGPNSYKAYSDNGDTFYAFMLPNSTDPGKMAVYLQLNDRNDNYVDQVQLGPPVPRSLASQQIRIALNVESIVIAFTTDRGSIQNDWDGLYNASLQGDQDTNHEVVVIEISRANFKPSAMLIFSTKGRDRVSSINISPDRIITIMGTTEGHVSSPSTSTDLNLNRAFVVAQFQPFGIDKVSSILNGADVEEGEVVESTNFTVTFKPIPLGMSVNGTPSVYFENLNCMSIMSNATTIMVTPPVLHSAPNPIRFVASPFKLSIEMSHLPYAPKVERYISLKLPVLTDIMPKSVSSLDNKHLNLTLNYFGSLFLNYLRIFVIFDRLNQEYRCEKRPSPDIDLLNASGTTLPCSIGAVPVGKGRIMLSFNDNNVSTDVSVDFAPTAADISISLTDLRDRDVTLSCRSFDIPFNSLYYHIQNNVSTAVAQLRQNDAEIPFGANTNLQTRNVFKIRRSSRDVAGVFAIPWHCTGGCD